MSNGYSDHDDEDDDDEYFAEVVDDFDPTGKEPRFVRLESLDRTPEDLAQMTVVDLVKLYREVRDQLGTDRKGYKAREARVKTHLMTLSMLLRDRGDALGVDSFTTPFGTAYRNMKEKFRLTGWTEFIVWLEQTKNFQVLQKRVSPNAVKEIREQIREENEHLPENERQAELPPGVECIPEIEFSVRAPSARKRKS